MHWLHYASGRCQALTRAGGSSSGRAAFLSPVRRMRRNTDVGREETRGAFVDRRGRVVLRTVTGSAMAPSRSTWRSPGSLLRIGLFLVLLVWAAIPIMWAGWRAHGHGVVTGAVGLDPTDQLSLSAWVRDASRHLLVGNLFGSEPERVFLHPMYLASGVLVRMGVNIAAVRLAVEPRGHPRRRDRDRPLRRALLPGSSWTSARVRNRGFVPVHPAGGAPQRTGRFGGLPLAWPVAAASDFVPSYYLWGINPRRTGVGLMALFVLRLESSLIPPASNAWRSKSTLATGSWARPSPGCTRGRD